MQENSINNGYPSIRCRTVSYVGLPGILGNLSDNKVIDTKYVAACVMWSSSTVSILYYLFFMLFIWYVIYVFFFFLRCFFIFYVILYTVLILIFCVIFYALLFSSYVIYFRCYFIIFLINIRVLRLLSKANKITNFITNSLFKERLCFVAMFFFNRVLNTLVKFIARLCPWYEGIFPQ